MGSVAAETFLLSVDSGFRFCILRAPAEAAVIRGAVIVAHPFAEELNRSRRMIALCAERLAVAGYVVLQADCLGCGDSSGNFGEVGWDDWLSDVERGLDWMASRYSVPAWIWGIRGGALLAAATLPRLSTPPGLIFWQPVVSGRQHLTQFLRLKLAAEMIEGAAERTSTQALLDQLAAGGALEVAGYTISTGLTVGMSNAELWISPNHARSIICVEVGNEPGRELSPAMAKRVAAWRSSGISVATSTVTGPAFWQTQEITEARALIDATVENLVEATR